MATFSKPSFNVVTLCREGLIQTAGQLRFAYKCLVDACKSLNGGEVKSDGSVSPTAGGDQQVTTLQQVSVL